MSLVMKLARSKDALQSNLGQTVIPDVTMVTPYDSDLLSSLKGTRIYMGAHLLRKTTAKPSAIFDLESFFWILLFVPLYQHRKRLGEWDKDKYLALVPESGHHQMDSKLKAGLILELEETDTFPEDSVLLQYEELLVNMANLARRYFRATLQRNFDSYSLVEEADAIDKYILIVKIFLEKHRSSLA